MKGFLCFWILCLPFVAFSQTNQPYAVWENPVNSTYYLVQIDPATGNKTLINSIPGMTGYVAPNTSTIDIQDSLYIFRGFFSSVYRMIALDLNSGALVYAHNQPENLVGLEYNCKNDSIYAIKEVNNAYSLISVDAATGLQSTIAAIPGVSAHVGSTFSLDPKLGTYTFKALMGSNLRLLQIDISTGSILNNNSFPDNVIGHEFNCNNDTTYGLWENQQNNTYNFVAIDPATGIYSIINALPGVNPGFVAETVTFNPVNNQYIFQGFMGPNFTLFQIDAGSGAITSSTGYSDNAAGFESPTCCNPCSLPQPSISFTKIDRDYTFSDSLSGATSWTWDFGDGIIDTVSTPSHSFDSAGTYIVCLTASNSCGSTTICDTLAVTCPFPNPFWTSFAMNQTNFIPADTTHGAYFWDFGDGTTSIVKNPTHTFPSESFFLVCLTVSNQCGDSTYCDSVLALSAPIHQVSTNFSFEISPNPTSDKLIVAMVSISDLSSFSLRMVNSQGKEVLRGKIKSTETILDISGLISGIYFLEIKGEMGRATKGVWVE